mmetsp:Transcript_153/g.218  ORF Transcript_153/g.218 Transcript_153/m.218 type:complete len:585 (+) Transcript_153:105-1859(+)
MRQASQPIVIAKHPSNENINNDTSSSLRSNESDRNESPLHSYHEEDNDWGHNVDAIEESAISCDMDPLLPANTLNRNPFLAGDGTFDALNSSMDGLTVGSLPSSRRERRMMVSTGIHEIYSGVVGSGHNNLAHHRHHRGSASRGHRGHTTNSHHRNNMHTTDPDQFSRSMPVPRAPFLSSRRDRKICERLSSIPQMDLPGSVTESNETQSMQYGSLRESKFHAIPHSLPHHSSGQSYGRVRFAQKPETGSFSNHRNDDFLLSSYSASHSNQFSQSVPGPGYFHGDNIHKDNFNLNNHQQPTTLIDNGNAFATNNTPKVNLDHRNNSVSGLTSLLDGMLSDNTDANKTPHTNPSTLSTDSNRVIDPIDKTLHTSNQSYLHPNIDHGGIRSSFEESSKSEQHISSSQYQSSHNNTIHSSSYTVHHDREIQCKPGNSYNGLSPLSLKNTNDPSSTPTFHREIMAENTHAGEEIISTSLTGLEILESSRRSPGGLGIHLTPAEKESVFQRARSLSNDGTGLLDDVGMSPPQKQTIHAHHHHTSYHPQSFNATHSPSNSHGDGSNLYDDRPLSPNNPDAVEAFAFDMDE